MFFDYTPFYPFFNICLVVYLPIVFGIKHLVDKYIDKENKEHLAESLKLPWASWCFGLSLFSAIGTYYTDTSFYYHAFILSKMPELLDTVFIVLRSKPLVSLQWYHHWATLAICYYITFVQCDKLLIPIFMNYFVHTFMYLYFGLYCFNQGKFMREVFGTFVNIIQTLQMFFAIAIGTYEYFVDIENVLCMYRPDGPEITKMYYFGTLMYLSYFVLFVQVFFLPVINERGSLYYYLQNMY